MKFEVEIDSKIVSVELIKKANIKHCYLRVLSDNEIQIKSHKYYLLDDAKSLIKDKKSWIISQLKLKEIRKINVNEFLFLGEVCKISDYKINNLNEFYKEKCSFYVQKIVKIYAEKMNLYPKKIKFRKNKNTWGSCNFKDELNFNYLLAKYPMYIMEYVVIHELSHIKHKNHSKDFWNLVFQYCPEYKEIQRKFKTFL